MNDSAYITPYQRTCNGPRWISTGFRVSTKCTLNALRGKAIASGFDPCVSSAMPSLWSIADHQRSSWVVTKIASMPIAVAKPTIGESCSLASGRRSEAPI
jgi:hypothetical protein